ncbi:MAG: T9SS type A sorting domain-containing protein [Ignavibacteriae bacterium]|nr:T9SS type A sorting domain-containing protein [Ignavibacteriota bacterium]
MKNLLAFLMIILGLTMNSLAQKDTMFLHLIDNSIITIPVSQIQSMKFDSLTGIDERTYDIKTFTLKGNYPNPFQTHTFLEFELTTSGNVEIIIYNNNGNKIKKLKCDNCQAGKNTLQWNCFDTLGNRVQSGIYYYEVIFNNIIQTKKMILIN